MSSPRLSIDIISIIISFASLHDLPSLSGVSQDVASLALSATRSRLRDITSQAIVVFLSDEVVSSMGVTAVCKLIKAYDDIQHCIIN